MTYVVLGLRGLLFAVFTVSVALKLNGRGAYMAFEQAAGMLIGLSGRSRRSAAALAAMGELGVLLALALPADSRVGFGLALGVLAIFSGALGSAIAQHRRVRCRCFGAEGTVVGVRHLVRNGLLIGVGCVGLVAAGGKGTPLTGAAVLALATGVIVGLVLTRWDDLSFLVAGDIPVSAVSSFTGIASQWSS